MDARAAKEAAFLDFLARGNQEDMPMLWCLIGF